MNMKRLQHNHVTKLPQLDSHLIKLCYTVMQTALQKIDKHFENMLSTSGGPPDPPIKDANVVENRQAVTEIVQQCLNPTKPL